MSASEKRIDDGCPGDDPDVTDNLSTNLRTAISLWLVVHLFAIGVALASNTSPMVMEVQRLKPDVKRQLRQVPGVTPYLRLLNMDTAFGAGNVHHSGDFHLTHGSQTDVDHTIEVDLKFDDGSEQLFVLPEPGVQPRLRRRRLQSLATRMSRLAAMGVEEAEGRLTRAVAAHLISLAEAEHGKTVTSGVIRCRSHMLQATTDIESTDLSQRDPFDDQYYRTAVEYRIVVSSGLIDLLKVESGTDSAPSTSPQ